LETQPAALLDQARAHHHAHRLETAVECFEKVLRIDPTNFDALIELGDVLEKLGRNTDTIALLEGSLAHLSDSASVHSRLADALQVQGDLIRAIEIYRRSIAIDPSFPGAWWGIGCAQNSLGDHA
jgi:tetratricopeptide (TPR) repeat protein